MFYNKFLLLFSFIFISNIIFCEDAQFRIKNSAYAYNGENAAYWEETRTTLTYFEDIIQPYFFFKLNSNVELKAGSGILIPFNQEDKIKNFYPYIQSKFLFDEYTLIIGSLDGNHNFPAPILDPLVNITPQVRVISQSQVPINYETNKCGLFTHGLYEYGIQYQWDISFGKGETYINWQLPDISQHRERFDLGLIHTYNVFYAGFHYWHNGGHENFHPIPITENYTGAAGLRNEIFSVLYLLSYFLPDRDVNPQLNIFGEGIYLEYNFSFFDFEFQTQGFLSDKFINTNNQFISIEGDPFYRVPLYVGFNVYRLWKMDKNISLKIGFVNGAFLPYVDSSFDWKMIRYDQLIKADIEYQFNI